MPRKILMTGGGTLGPVTPLIAIAKEWQRQEADVIIEWIGTSSGPERELVTNYGYNFQSLSVPKLSRGEWLTWPLILPLLAISVWKSLGILKVMRPDIVFTVGGYTSVPIVWMAKILSIPVWVHQLDVQVGFANKLMAPFASRVSVTWEESSEAFGAEKTLVVGGMTRPEIRQGSRELFLRDNKLDPDKKTLLVFGGGTGSKSINDAMLVIGKDISTRMNVVHITGKGKMNEDLHSIGQGYIAVELLKEEMKHALAAADIVVARAGMGTILELIALNKSAVIIPLPGSQQEKNAELVMRREIATVIFHLTPQVLKQEILKLSRDKDLNNRYRKNMRKTISMEADRKIVNKAMELV